MRLPVDISALRVPAHDRHRSVSACSYIPWSGGQNRRLPVVTRTVGLGLLLSISLCAQEAAATAEFTGMRFSIPTDWHRADVSTGVKLAPVGLPEKQEVAILL